MFNPYIDARLMVIESEMSDLQHRLKDMNNVAKKDAKEALIFWADVIKSRSNKSFKKDHGAR